MKIKRSYFLLPLWWILLFFLSGVLGAFISTSFSVFLGALNVNFIFLCAFLFWKVIFTRLIPKKWYPYFRFRWLFEVVFYLIVVQTVFLLFSPTSALVPEKVKVRIGSVQKTEPLGTYDCSVEEAYKEAKEFVGDAVDFEEVKVVYGGIPKLMEDNIGAMVYQNKIHVNSTYCDNRSYLSRAMVHELAHVWQYQNNLPPPGPGNFFSVLQVLKGRLLNPDHHFETYYYYGGEEGLKEAIDAGKSIYDFNTEQQAEILSRYYDTKRGARYDRLDNAYTQEYIEYLEHFANQILE